MALPVDGRLRRRRRRLTRRGADEREREQEQGTTGIDSQRTDELDIALVPAIELHDGVHGSLLRDPPSGVRYHQPACRHRFLVDSAQTAFHPERDAAVAELVLVPPGTGLVHSSRLPVAGADAWLVDADDLGVTWLHGRDLAFATAASEGSGRIPPPLRPEQSRRRADAMMRRHLDRRCVAILLRSRRAVERAIELIETSTVLSAPDKEHLVDLLAVVRPAVPPIRRRPPGGTRLRVLVVDRHTEVKGSPIALQAYADAYARHPDRLELVWVGRPPPAWPEGVVEHHELLPRATFLDVLASADVLLAPTEHESFGMLLLEAAAAGLAIVASGGPSVIMSDELLADGRSALLVPVELPAAPRRRLFAEQLARVTREDALRVRLGGTARELVLNGPCSLARRDRALQTYYGRMSEMMRAGPDVSGGEQGPSGLGRVDIPESWLILRHHAVLGAGHTNVTVSAQPGP